MKSQVDYLRSFVHVGASGNVTGIIPYHLI